MVRICSARQNKAAREVTFHYIIDDLLAVGADEDAVDTLGRTPLMLAASAGIALITQLLLAAGADANILDKEGNSALLLVCQKRGTAIWNTLSLNKRFYDDDNANPSNAMSTAMMLISHGVDVSIVDKAGKTAGDYMDGDRDQDALMRFVIDKAAKRKQQNMEHAAELSQLRSSIRMYQYLLKGSAAGKMSMPVNSGSVSMQVEEDVEGE